MNKIFNFFAVIVFATSASGDPLSDVSLPQKRSDAVGFAKTILALRDRPIEPVDPAAIKNPFNPIEPLPSVNASANVVEAMPVQSDRARLEKIAPKVTPSGSVQIGGEAYLLFGQKRLKVGDHLPIIFEGNSYELQLSGIQSTSFTLRLNGVEITRPIKSSNKP